MSSDSLDRVETLAKIGASLISVQFEALEFSPDALEHDLFAHGYCFGLFDAMAQCARMDQFSDGAATIAEGFTKLTSDRARGQALFDSAMARMDEPSFSGGYERGAADLMAWAGDANALPKGLAARGRR